MFSFFSSDNTPDDAKTMAEYYDDLADIVTQVHDQFPDANSDPAFKQAATVLTELASLCRDIESVSAMEANDINKQRGKLQYTMGKDGLMDVTGSASKLLAEKYIQLLRDSIDKKYWPSADCPKFPPYIGKSYATEYAANFETSCEKMESKIETLQSRIADYDHSIQLRPAI
ncbi:MAG TPA: hypothetical protein VL360_02835 [Gammaproteobacteria bacterium]|nr:hypothetical protein [Gammaproteobacteria bacterium]